VPYRGTYVTDLMAGQVQVAFTPMPQALELIKTGKLRALAVTTVKRQAALPDVPSIGETVPGYEASGWYGLAAPRNTPADVVNKLSEALNAALADAKLQARLSDLGVEARPMTPAQFGTFIAGETDKWAKVIKSAGIKPD
jgi:tripartite-type tricarboxylate transporter receptor subunit TctC